MKLASIGISVLAPTSLTLAGSVRRHVVEVVSAYVSDEDALSRVGLGTHELMDNSLRHALDGLTTMEATLEVADGEGRFVLVTHNRCRDCDREAVLAEVRQTAQDIDPEEFYDRVIRRSVGRPGSGLGLARVWAEAQLRLHCSAAGDQLTVQAMGMVPLRSRP